MGPGKRGWRRALGASVLALAAWSTAGLSVTAAAAVPTFSQRSHQWSRDALGSDPIDTIGSAGCALTAVTMVTAAYGYPTNPQQLNRWLTEHGGYIENDLLLWRQAAAATQGSVRWQWLHVPGIVSQLKTGDQDIEDLPPQSLVEAQLDAGRLVVAEVRLYGGRPSGLWPWHSRDILNINSPASRGLTTLAARFGNSHTGAPCAQTSYPG